MGPKAKRLLGTRRAKAVALCTVLLTLTATATALAVSAQAGKVMIEIEGGISPTRLAKKTPTPITLKINGAIKTTDGSHVPALKTLDLEFDKHGTIYTKGLPTCSPSKLQATTTAAALKACPGSLVGKGRSPPKSPSPNRPPSTPPDRS